MTRTVTGLVPDPVQTSSSLRLGALIIFAVLAVAGCSASVSSSAKDPVLVDASEALELPLSDGLDEGPERIVAPDFEVELQPGQDVDDVLGPHIATDGDGETVADQAIGPRPDDAILSLCPAVESIIMSGSVSLTDVRLQTILDDTPAELHAVVIAITTGGDPGASTAALDGHFVSVCSVPLHAAYRQLDELCEASTEPVAACRAGIVDRLGGLCFDDAHALLSCVSGLPASEI